MFNLELTFILGYVFYGLVIVIHLLIIQKIIPYQLVNGGRSESYLIQKKVSTTSALIGLLGLGFMVFSQVFSGVITHWLYFTFVGLLTLFWLFGFILQVLGTRFERLFLSWVNILGFLVHLSLTLEFLL